MPYIIVRIKTRRKVVSTSTVTSKGQITIPASVRQRLGIDVGDRVEFVELADGEFAIRAAVHDVCTLKGMLKKPKRPVSIVEMKTTIRNRGASK